jgi:hypothetical protein
MASARKWVAMQITFWCEFAAQQQTYRARIRTTGLLQKVIHALEEQDRIFNSLGSTAANEDASSPYGRKRNAHGVQDLRMVYIQALSRCICDDKHNAMLASQLGVLGLAGKVLLKDLEHDCTLCLNRITLCNSVCATTSSVTDFLQDSGIVPVLASFADTRTKLPDKRMRYIASACLANLSNYDGAVDVLVRGGALDVLARGLHEYSADDLSHDRIRFPSVAYMQALAAVVKIVGRGAYMGGRGLYDRDVSGVGEGGRGMDADDVFRVCGDKSSLYFDPTTMRGMELDRRSVIWMLHYLRAAIADLPFPPMSNIYGRPWKVSCR